MQHFLNLHPQPFESIKSGTKKVEMRLFDEKRRAIKVGDIITFTNNHSGERLDVIVQSIQVFADFFELYAHFDKASIGYAPNEVANPDDMLAFYSRENVAKYGVVAITVGVVC